MSWVNRNIPRKRDISKIPEELRPVIIPRVRRPEVIISESFQDRPRETKETKSEIVNKRQYVSKKIDSSLKIKAYELSFNKKSYVFVILRNIRNVRDNDLWISAYNSIRTFYTNKIIIIDDNSSINTVDGKLFNTEVIKSEFNGAGEILPYFYFYKNKWADRMIFLHDSMFLNRLFRDEELTGDVKFHWNFENEIKDKRKIVQYISMLKDYNDLYDYIDGEWKGCFGGASIINLDSVVYVEEKYNLFSTLVLHIKTRQDREAFERILGIVMYYENMVDSNFGNIMKYPNAFESNNIETAQHMLNGYDTAIVKVWKGR